jgi:YHS domain-containing protein
MFLLAGACRSADDTARGASASPAAAPAAEPTACEETCSDPAPSAAARAEDEVFPECLHGCGTSLPYREDQLVSQPGARAGDFTRCPVSKVVFVVDGNKTPARSHEGKPVFFCCEPCADRFSQTPAKYASRLTAL